MDICPICEEPIEEDDQTINISGQGKALLVDVDGKIPNLALMKVSTHLKSQGYEVELLQCGMNYYKKIKEPYMVFADGYESVWVSIIFKNNKKNVLVLGCDNVHWGGTGYDIRSNLPGSIDDLEEDYSLYPENNKSYGFITRGCIRNCYFCVVPEKEGKIRLYREPEQIIKHREAVFLDNNILAYRDCEKVLERLVELGIRCHFSQGLDIRLLTDKKAQLLSKLNYHGEYIFAFDNLEDEKIIASKLELFKQYEPRPRKVKLYIYCHPDMSITEDVMYRVQWCKEHEVLPYLMRDESCFAHPNVDVYTDLAAWCNQPRFFKNTSFDGFLVLRHPENMARVRSSLDMVVNNK